MNEKELTYGGTIKQPLHEFETWEFFASYLLDNCEGETITEESLQGWLVESEKEREKRNSPHAEIKAEYEKAIADGKIVKVFSRTSKTDTFREVRCDADYLFDQPQKEYQLRYYNIDWNKLLSWSYANDEFIKVHVSDYEWLGASVHYGVLTSYFVGSFGMDNNCNRWKCCRLASDVTIKDEWLKEIK